MGELNFFHFSVHLCTVWTVKPTGILTVYQILWFKKAKKMCYDLRELKSWSNGQKSNLVWFYEVITDVLSFNID